MKPIAWMHDAGRFDVIHDEVKNLWLAAGRAEHVEHYTIPLFEGSPNPSVLPLPSLGGVGAVEEEAP